ncbi:MAG TPA: TldD/PmbA family protein [Candidatus Polarisedimenticolia bacterium]|nr:TldD/PmbA family protein [Candidatus Polarisedimenticolia bacterium]
MTTSRSRREFLQTCGAGAAAWAATALIPGETLIQRAEAAAPAASLGELASFALERARAEGASYADVRINRYRTQVVSLRSQPDFATGKLNHVPAISDAESFGFGVRVLAGGAWGFAASNQVNREAVARASREAVAIGRTNAALRRAPVRLAPVGAHTGNHRTPIRRDPFEVPVGEKLDLMRAVNEEVKKVDGVFSAVITFSQRMEHRFFSSTEGSVIEQHVHQISPELTATAVEKGRRSKTRTYRPHAVTAGYEAVERAAFMDHARRVGEEAAAHLKAPPVEAGVKDLVLLPSHLGLTIHESIGHSTELDRALGWEANFAGTSFLTPDKLNTFRVGSDIVHVFGDRVRPESLSTCGYDDDGVKTRQFPILSKGIFVGYQTIRDQAHLIGQDESMGCCYADSFASIPFQRMPNVWLAPSPGAASLRDLVSGVDDGVLIDGRGSYSIDQQRYNFQFGGDAFWEIKGGKVGRMIADVAYQSRTPDFWQACDGLGGEASWENVGLNADGKGQPQQVNAMSHGCPPARFRRVNVLRTE